MQNSRRNRPCMSIKVVKKNWITRLAIRSIWKLRIYDCGSRGRGGAPSFILVKSAHSRSQKPSQLPRITLSLCPGNTKFSPKFTLNDWNFFITMIPSCSQVENCLICPSSMLKMDNMRLKLSWIIEKWGNHDSSWCTRKVTQIWRILQSKRRILIDQWYVFIWMNWSRKRIRHIKLAHKPLRHHQKVREGGV